MSAPNQIQFQNTLFDEYSEFNHDIYNESLQQNDHDFISSYNKDHSFDQEEEQEQEQEQEEVENQSYSIHGSLSDLAKHAESKRQERRRLYVQERGKLRMKPNPNDLLQLKKYMSYILTSKIVDIVNHPYLLAADPK